ncbi:MAG: hypothetical protein CUN56_09895 [Phototrophicales bacterium]|nr:MAG: hypothetical protein CUN56_09895 [Phototrophicales bacterium]
MPGNIIQANYEQLEQIAQQFLERSENTDQVLQAVRRQIEDLQRDGWWGEGANAFYAEMEDEVLPRVVRLRNALNRAGETTRKIAEILEEAEDRAAGGFNQQGDSGAVGGAHADPGRGGTGGAVPVAGGSGNTGGGSANPGRGSGGGVPSSGGGAHADPGRGTGGGMPSSGGGTGSGRNSGANSSINGYKVSAKESAKLGIGLFKERRLEDGAVRLKNFLDAKASTSSVAKYLTDAAAKYPGMTKVLGKVTGGLTDGLVDFALGGNYSGKELGIQTVSGVLQVPLAKIKLAEAGIQIVGNAGAELIQDNARWIANNDRFLERFIQDRSAGFKQALSNLSIDNTVDGIVRSFSEDGASWKAVGRSAEHVANLLVNGVGGTVVEGAGMLGGTLYGLGDRAAEAVGDFISNDLSNAVDEVGDLLNLW